MKLISSALSNWYVPRSHHESLKTLADSYLKKLEDYKKELEDYKNYTQEARRIAEANKIMALYIKQIALEGIFDKVDDEDLETDHFYKILLSQTKATRASREGLIKDIRKIAAIALGDGELEESPYSLDEDELDQVLTAITSLRGSLSDHREARDAVMAENRNLLASLTLSQQEVADLQQQVKELRARYTERSIKIAEVSVDIDRKLKELNELNVT